MFYSSALYSYSFNNKENQAKLKENRPKAVEVKARVNLKALEVKAKVNLKALEVKARVNQQVITLSCGKNIQRKPPPASATDV